MNSSLCPECGGFGKVPTVYGGVQPCTSCALPGKCAVQMIGGPNDGHVWWANYFPPEVAFHSAYGRAFVKIDCIPVLAVPIQGFYRLSELTGTIRYQWYGIRTFADRDCERCYGFGKLLSVRDTLEPCPMCRFQNDNPTP